MKSAPMKSVLALIVCLSMLLGLCGVAAADAPEVDALPSTVAVAAGKTASVSVSAEGDGLTYAWYYKDAGSSSFKRTSTFTGNTYSVKMNEDRSGRQIYCRVTDEDGNSTKTNTVTLRMTASLAITSIPKSVTVAEGETAKVSLTAIGEGLTYTWYYKDAGSSSFKRTSTFTGNTYSVRMNDARDGRRVYCKVADKHGNTLSTKPITLSMNAGLELTPLPDSASAEIGETVKVSFTASGEGLTYTWYYKDAGSSSFRKTSTFTGNTYSVKMNEDRAGRQVYCKVTDKYGNYASTNTATLLRDTGLTITSQPRSVIAANGATAKVSFTASGEGLTYAWYYRDAGSSSFKRTSTFTGNTYSVKMNEDRAGRQVYCRVTDKYGNFVKTDTVSLEMFSSLAITAQPEDVAVAEGSTAKVSFTASGSGLTYTWYYRNAGTSAYRITSAFTGTTYSVRMDESRDGRQVYCKVTDKYGNTVTTRPAKLSMLPLE